MIFSGRITTSIDANYPFGADLNFDEVDVNIGEAFDGDKFKVPISGIYKFTFSGRGGTSFTYIAVLINDKATFHIKDGKLTEGAAKDNFSYTWMMELKAGDDVKLRARRDLYVNPGGSAQDIGQTFTGELIHID